MMKVARGSIWSPLRTPRRGAAALTVGGALLVGAGVASAAHPQAGARFAGTSSLAPINGFKAPVTFRVSRNGGKLTGFAYSSLGCFGAGGFRPGVDYFTQPSAIIRVGTVKVLKSGSFSASGTTSVTSHGVTTTTTTKVNGMFTTAKLARGVVTFQQRASGSFTATCGPAKLSFTAKRKRH